MRVYRLQREWILTTEHSASSYGRHVLVHEPTGQAYGWGDYMPEEACTAGEWAEWAADGHDPETVQAAHDFAHRR